MMRRFHPFVPVLTALLLAPLSAQDDPPAEPTKPDPVVAEKLDELKDVVGDRKFERDAEANDIITKLVEKWREGLVDKDKKAIVKGLEMTLLKGKLRPADRMQIYNAAATALGLLGVDGSKPLQKAIDGSRFPNKEEWVPLRESMLKALGKTKDEDAIKFLTDVARRDPEAALQAAAGEALGNFADSEEKIRKEIVSDLLIKYGEMDSRAREIDPADLEAQNQRKRLAVISGKWNDTLRRLTGQDFDAFPKWNEWHNKNKNKDWN
ncbi:MAG: hypothetical protein AB7O97_01410 [Planctomycetota bacterium]